MGEATAEDIAKIRGLHEAITSRVASDDGLTDGGWPTCARCHVDVRVAPGDEWEQDVDVCYDCAVEERGWALVALGLLLAERDEALRLIDAAKTDLHAQIGELGGDAPDVDAPLAKYVVALTLACDAVLRQRDEALLEVLAYQGRPEGALAGWHVWPHAEGRWMREFDSGRALVVTRGSLAATSFAGWEVQVWSAGSSTRLPTVYPSPRAAMRAAESAAVALGWPLSPPAAPGEGGDRG